MKWDHRVPYFEGAEEVFANPVTEHIAESRWQTCDCKTCQRKRATYDSLPGKKIDWERHRRTPNSEWHYNAIFYVGE